MTTPKLAKSVRGKGRMYTHPDGHDVPSVTNIIDMMNKPALPRWAAKAVAERAWEIRARLASADQEQRDYAVAELKGSPWKYAGQRADVGSLVHDIADALATDSDLPTFGVEEAAYADQFLDWATSMDVRFLASEVTVFGQDYGGTFDWYADIGGRKILGDHKTGKAVYDEVSLQLAALRYAQTWIVGDEPSIAQPIDACAVLHLRQDGWTLYEVDAGEDADNAFRGLLAAWRWKHLDIGTLTAWKEGAA